MLVKPILANTKVIDVTKNNNISFIVIGGEQFSGFTYEIYNNSTSTLVKTEDIISQLPSFDIQPNILSNGAEYKIRLKTCNTTGQYSEFSDYMVLKCYSVAKVSIDNFTIEDGIKKIKNQKYVFEGSYSQTENIKLKCFRYILYQEDGTLIKEYPWVYQQDYVLQQYIDGLDNYSWYRIQLVCIDQNDITTSNGIDTFYVDYKPPKIRQVVNLTNDKESASIIIESDARQLIFKTVGDMHFIDSQKLDITNDGSYIYMDNACTIGSDFTLQLWMDKCFVNKEFAVLKNKLNSDDKIILFYSNDNRFHVRKNIGTIIMEYISDEIILNNMPFTVFVQQVKGRIDILASILN